MPLDFSAECLWCLMLTGRAARIFWQMNWKKCIIITEKEVCLTDLRGFIKKPVKEGRGRIGKTILK